MTRILNNPTRLAFRKEGKVSKDPPAEPEALRLLVPQRSLTAIAQYQNREPFIVQSLTKVLNAVSPAKAGVQAIPGFRVAFHLPGMTILHAETVKLRESPDRAGGYLRAN